MNFKNNFRRALSLSLAMTMFVPSSITSFAATPENGETKLTLTNTYSYTVKLPGTIDLTYNGNKDGVSLYDIDKY